VFLKFFYCFLSILGGNFGKFYLFVDCSKKLYINLTNLGIFYDGIYIIKKRKPRQQCNEIFYTRAAVR